MSSNRKGNGWPTLLLSFVHGNVSNSTGLSICTIAILIWFVNRKGVVHERVENGGLAVHKSCIESPGLARAGINPVYDQVLATLVDKF